MLNLKFLYNNLWQRPFLNNILFASFEDFISAEVIIWNIFQYDITIIDDTRSKCDLKNIKQHSFDTDNQDDSQDSSESIKPNAIYEIVQAVRKETQLSHEMSKVAVETVLISLRVSVYYSFKRSLQLLLQFDLYNFILLCSVLSKKYIKLNK